MSDSVPKASSALSPALPPSNFLPSSLSRRLPRPPGTNRTLLNYTAQPTVGNVFMALMLWAHLRRRGIRLSTDNLGLRPLRWTTSGASKRFRRMALPALLLLVLGASPLGTWTIDRLWSVQPGPSWALGNPASYRGHFPLHITASLIAFQLLVRIPLTVLTEEVLFRGYLQPRAGRGAPVKIGVLFAFYHLGQWWTIPELIPFGIAFGLIRWWTGTIWVGVGAHYVSDALYLLMATLT